jgi:PPK2 family polyphosphate:nucleotide phosphotransferase
VCAVGKENSMLDRLRVAPGDAARLDDRDPRDDLGLTDKASAKDVGENLLGELFDLQRLLWAEDRRSVLLVLQGMDTSGKDGTIRRVFTGLNPQGVHVASFKKPTEHELDHDYLWRVHAACPPRGSLGIFNRSHYEDVGIVRVNRWIDEDEVQRRFGQIRRFEQHLADNGTAIRKVFLHISKDEQRERLQERIDTPEKHWKFNLDDLEARKQWDDYMRAYEDAITATSMEDAPWFVVPADRKWVRDVAVTTILADALRSMDLRPPEPDPALRGIVVE